MSAREKPSSGLVGAGILIVDKEAGITSHDVVARCRKLLNTRKVGHAGTLDPMATGVLVLGVERATKLLGLLALTTKAYSATIRLGAATDTDDAEGEVLTSADASQVTDAEIAAIVATLTGDIKQIPASVSAIKVDGQRAHAPGGFVDLDVDVECSSGTYIRSLARDLGRELGVGGHLTALRRTRVGPFTLEHARTLEDLADQPGVSLDIDQAAQTAFPHRQITAEEAEAISQGRWLEPIGMKGICAAIDPTGHTIALLQEKGRRASSVMVVRPATLRG